MATPEATARYLDSIDDAAIRQHGTSILGRTGYRVSAVGFGGYRVDVENTVHRKALEHALLHGVNLIDTSSNYTDGGSERLIGDVVSDLIRRRHLERDQIVVVSKVGYVQGKNLEIARAREEDGKPFPDVVKYAEGCWHCIHPEFLEDQLARTLRRLRMDSVDVYLLHNPEYYLADALQQGIEDIEAVRDLYYERIALAFDWMEEKVRDGRIRWYGVSSNTFPDAPDDPEFTSLERVWRAAESVGDDHHFGVIQFPMNLFEPGAATRRNQGEGTKTVLQLARERGLGALVNRPLNAMNGDDLTRLADFRMTDPATLEAGFLTRQTALAAAEKRFREEFLPALPAEAPRAHLEKVFTLSGQLAAARTSFPSWESWDHVRQNAVLPPIQSILGYLHQLLRSQPGWRAWAAVYLKALDDFLDVITRHYENQAQARSAKIGGRLERLAPALADSATLSQKSVRLLRSVEGVSGVLVGMRKMEYVDDALAALRLPPVPEAEAVLNLVRDLRP